MTVRSSLAASLLAAASMAATAAPVASTPGALAPGVQGHWVDVSTSPHSIGDALSALVGANGFVIVQTVDAVHPVINVGDCCAASTVDPLTALGDDSFAVHYTGYLHIATAGSYTFNMHHDDGIRVNLGGETIIVYPSDTGPRDSTSASYDLEAGYYALDVVGWEQGGSFINRFSMRPTNSTAGFVIAQDLWHEANRTPEPAGLALAGLALLAAARARRR